MKETSESMKVRLENMMVMWGSNLDSWGCRMVRLESMMVKSGNMKEMLGSMMVR